MKEIAQLLDEIRNIALRYVFTKDTAGKPWHWHQDWTKAKLLALGEELGYTAFPEYPCFNPESRSQQGRIDVAWGKEMNGDFKPEIAIEICKGMPRRRDIAKLSALSGQVVCVVICLKRDRRIGNWRQVKGKTVSAKSDHPRTRYHGLAVDRIWFIHYRAKPQLMSEWLGAETVMRPVFNQGTSVVYPTNLRNTENGKKGLRANEKSLPCRHCGSDVVHFRLRWSWRCGRCGNLRNISECHRPTSA